MTTSPTRLHGIKAIVTGGIGGIGAAIVRRLVDEGAEVTILDLLADSGDHAGTVKARPSRLGDGARGPRARAHRDEQRIGGIAKALAGHRLDMRDAIGDLSRTMSRLGESETGFRGALDNPAGEIEQAMAASRRLQATADRMVV